MPTYTQVASQLLNDAAMFFKNVAESNADVAQDMLTNAEVFENLAGLLLNDPSGSTGGEAHTSMAAKLLGDSSKFFLSLANDNEPIREQMTENAKVFHEISLRLADDPFGEIEE